MDPAKLAEECAAALGVEGVISMAAPPTGRVHVTFETPNEECPLGEAWLSRSADGSFVIDSREPATDLWNDIQKGLA